MEKLKRTIELTYLLAMQEERGREIMLRFLKSNGDCLTR